MGVMAITHELSELILKFTNVDSTFIWLAPQVKKNSYIFSTSENELRDEEIARELEQAWENLRDEEIALIQISEPWYYLAPIKTGQGFYGFIGVLWDEMACSEAKEELLKKTKTTAEWSAMVYERLYTENLRVRSTLETERKRISAEIHDLISGRLFGAVCAASVLTRTADLAEKDREQLKLMARTINQALRDLRSIIHSLDAASDEQWFEKTKHYLDDIARLHGIFVSWQIHEESTNIDDQMAKALHRIICEAANNAVKHGRCQNLSVELVTNKAELGLSISDDGIGFEQAGSYEHQGLGLSNIKRLANAMNASLVIKSDLGQGTRIKIIVPRESSEVPGETIYEEEAS